MEEVTTPSRPEPSTEWKAVWNRLITKQLLLTLLESVRNKDDYEDQIKSRVRFLTDIKDSKKILAEGEKGFGQKPFVIKLNKAIEDPTKENLDGFYKNVLEIYDKNKKEENTYEKKNGLAPGDFAAVVPPRFYSDAEASPRKQRA